jgi:hypothetical protein
MNSPSCSVMKMAGMSHLTVGHLPMTLKTYSQPFGNASDWRRTVSKHYHCLLKKIEIVFICKVFNNARTEKALTMKKMHFCHLCDCRYSAHAPHATPPTRLACAATDNWSKDSAILHSRKSGVGFDSSHHNKNENFAPVTLLTTVNDFGRMVPSEWKQNAGYHLALILELCSHHLHLRGHSDDHIGTIFDRDKGCD